MTPTWTQTAAERTAERRFDERPADRIPMGVMVRAHFAGRVLPATVELVDVVRGACYLHGVTARVGAKLAFGFVLPGRSVCLVRGRVARVEPRGFVVAISAANEAFEQLLDDLSARTQVHAA